MGNGNLGSDSAIESLGIYSQFTLYASTQRLTPET